MMTTEMMMTVLEGGGMKHGLYSSVGGTTVTDNWVSPWLFCHPFSQYSPTGSTQSDEWG
jgi:hypothetical protein